MFTYIIERHTYLLKVCARIFTATLFALAPNERQLNVHQQQNELKFDLFNKVEYYQQ